GQWATDRDVRASLGAGDRKADRIDRGFRRAVQIGDPANRETAQNLLVKFRRERLATQHQMVETLTVQNVANDGCQIGRYATDEGDAVPGHFLPKTDRRVADRIADDDGCPATEKRQQRLLDRSVERTGDEQ